MDMRYVMAEINRLLAGIRMGAHYRVGDRRAFLFLLFTRWLRSNVQAACLPAVLRLQIGNAFLHRV